MNVEIVSVCNRIPDRAREPYYRFDMFLKSLEAFGVAPTILGRGEPWGGLMTKPRRLREWLRAGHAKAEILIVCDAFDIVFARHPDKVADDYILATVPGPSGRPIMFNAERGIFPRPELEHVFKAPGPWKYLNSGFMIGRPDKILALLEAMWLDDISDDHQAGDDLHGGAGRWIHPNDQGWFQAMYAMQPVEIVVDSACQVCQCLSACAPEEFDLSGSEIRNVTTRTTPGVFHFNGGSKNDLMPIFLKHWGLE